VQGCRDPEVIGIARGGGRGGEGVYVAIAILLCDSELREGVLLMGVWLQGLGVCHLTHGEDTHNNSSSSSS